MSIQVMSIQENKLILEDVERILSNKGIPWDKLSDSSVMITGATGLIGSLITKALFYHSVRTKSRLSLIAVVRNAKKAEHVFRAQIAENDSIIQFISADLSEELKFSGNVDYIIHAASITSSASFVDYPVDTIMTALNSTRLVLDVAKAQNSKSVVFLSSLEVYGKLEKESADETDCGELQILEVRNSYPQAKRMAETLCKAYHSQFGVPTRIVRLTQTFGPGVAADDQRVFAQFARAVVNGNNIVLHTRGTTKRDYLYTADAAIGILSVMLLGQGGEAYNLSNPDSYISIYDMAQLCTQLNEKVQVICDIDEEKAKKYLGEIKITLNNEKINKINLFERTSLMESYKRLIEFWSI